MFSFVLALVFVVCTTLIGNTFANKLTSRRRSLELMLGAVKKAKTLICFGSYEVNRVVEECFASEDFPLFDKDVFSDSTLSFDKAFLSAVSSVKPVFSLNKSDKELLVGFGKGLGVTDATGQVAHAELYTELLLERLKSIKEQEANKVKLYRLLGFSAGCAITLMVI